MLVGKLVDIDEIVYIAVELLKEELLNEKLVKRN